MTSIEERLNELEREIHEQRELIEQLVEEAKVNIDTLQMLMEGLRAVGEKTGML